MKIDGLLLSLTKGIRAFIFTSLAITVPFFLSSKDVNSLYISIVVLSSLAISTMFLYLYTYVKIQIKAKLILVSSLLFVSLIFLFLYETTTALIISMIVGSMSFAGRDLTVNQSLESYTMSTYTEVQREKNLMFSIYNFTSYGAGALGSAILFLYGSSDYSMILLILAILSAVQLIIYLVMKFPAVDHLKQKETLSDPDLRKRISHLAILFSVDSLGGGLVNTAILTLWFKVVYNVTLSQAGLIFAVVNVITALSVIGSNYISNRMGLVRTMVYTHLVSNLFLFMVPVFHSLIISELFLYLRQSTSQMDVPARDSFTNTYIPKNARISGNSTFLAVRNGGQIPGPGIAGVILEVFPGGVFFAASLTKIAYDLAFYTGFRHFKE